MPDCARNSTGASDNIPDFTAYCTIVHFNVLIDCSALSEIEKPPICSYIPMDDFEWDAFKDASNQRKHGIGFREASQIFSGLVIVAPDRRRDYGEPRWVALGEYDGDVIRVVFTERGSVVRIISAWKANRNERETYRKAKQDRAV
jgi:uncharacterized DUF497 family protein